MLLLSGLFFVTVFPLVKAVALFTALQTLPLVPPTPALSGWTPRPTTPSEPELVRRLLEGRQLKTICACGRKATMNVRVDPQGNAIKQGHQVEIGGNTRYVSTCRRHFKEALAGKPIPQPTARGNSASPFPRTTAR